MWDRSEYTETLSSRALYALLTAKGFCVLRYLYELLWEGPFITWCELCNLSMSPLLLFLPSSFHNSFSRLTIPHQWKAVLPSSYDPMLEWRSGQFSQVPEDKHNWERSWGYNKTIHPHGDNIPDSKVRQVWCRPISSNLIRVQDSKRISTWNILSLFNLVI